MTANTNIFDASDEEFLKVVQRDPIWAMRLLQSQETRIKELHADIVKQGKDVTNLRTGILRVMRLREDMAAKEMYDVLNKLVTPRRTGEDIDPKDKEQWDKDGAAMERWRESARRDQ